MKKIEYDLASRAEQMEKLKQELEAEVEIQSHPEVFHLFEEVMGSVSNIIDNLDSQNVSCSCLYTYLLIDDSFLQIGMMNYRTQTTLALESALMQQNMIASLRSSVIKALFAAKEAALDDGLQLRLRNLPALTPPLTTTSTPLKCKCRGVCAVGCPCRKARADCTLDCSCKGIKCTSHSHSVD